MNDLGGTLGGRMKRRDWVDTFFDREYVELLKDQKGAAGTRQQVDFILEVLGIAPPARILDVACGFGRHSRELARRGFEVVGVDNSTAMLREARRQKSFGSRLRYCRTDMRRLEFKNEFDAVINMFTSFGYFSHRDNLTALRRICRAVRSGGRVLIDSRDRDFDTVMHAGRGNAYRCWWPVGFRRLVLEEADFDPAVGVARSRWSILVREGNRYRLIKRDVRVQVYSLRQWDSMLRSCGVKRVAAYSDFEIAPFRAGRGPRLIVVGRKS